MEIRSWFVAVVLFFSSVKFIFLVTFGCSGSSLSRLSLVAVSWGYSLFAVHRLLIAVASPVVEHWLQAHRLRNCSSWVLDHRLSSYNAWAYLPVAVESSRIRDGTRAPCVGRILIHCTARGI